MLSLLLVGTIEAGVLLGNDGIFHKAAKAIGIDNLVNVGVDARVKVLSNEVGIDGAVGIGGKGIGAHASADADVLGQKAKVHADILDGHKIDQHNHEVFRDSQNRQYILQRQYIGSKSVQVRKYLDNGKIYVDGANEDNALQHQHVDDYPNRYNIYQGKIYDVNGGWWDLTTKRYYNRLGQWISSRIWDPRILMRSKNADKTRIYDNDGGWWDLTTRRYYNKLGQWISSRIWDPTILFRENQSAVTKIYDQDGGWWDVNNKRYYNRLGQWVSTRAWNPNILLRYRPSDVTKMYDQDGGWWDLNTKRYYNRLGQWVSTRAWDPNMLIRYRHANKSRFYDNDGGWWDLMTRRYYNRDGQWIRGRIWNEKILNLAQQQQQNWQQWELQQQSENENQQHSKEKWSQEQEPQQTKWEWAQQQNKQSKEEMNQEQQEQQLKWEWDQEQQQQDIGWDQQQDKQHKDHQEEQLDQQIKQQQPNWKKEQQQWNQQQVLTGHQPTDKMINVDSVNGVLFPRNEYYKTEPLQDMSRDRHATVRLPFKQLSENVVDLSSNLPSEYSHNTDATVNTNHHKDNKLNNLQIINRNAELENKDSKNMEIVNFPSEPHGATLKKQLLNDSPKNIVSKEAGVEISSMPLVATSRDRDATVRIPSENRLDEIPEKVVLNEEDFDLSSVPLVATSRDRDATVRIPSENRLNIIPEKVVLNKEDFDLSSVPLVATSRDRDATVRIPLEQRLLDDIPKSVISNEEVSELYSVPLATSSIHREQAANLVATSRDKDELVKIPRLPQDDLSSVHSSEEITDKSSRLAVGSSYDRDATVILRPQKDKMLDGDEVVTTSRDSDATNRISIEHQLLHGIPRNVVSNKKVIELSSVPFVATSRDRDGTIGIPLEQQSLDDILRDEVSNEEVVELSSAPLVATSRDRNATVRIPLGEPRLLKDVISRERMANLTSVPLSATSRDALDKILHVSQGDSSSDQLYKEFTDISSRLKEGTSYDRDASVIFRPQNDMLEGDDVGKVVATSRDSDAIDRISIKQQQLLNDIPWNVVSNEKVVKLSSMPLVATSRDRDATIRIPLEQRLLDDIPRNVVSNEEVVELPSVPLLATSRDRDATARIHLGEPRLLKDVITRDRLANLPTVPLVATSRDRDALVKVPQLSQNDSSSVQLNKEFTDMSSRLQEGTSYNRDLTVNLSPKGDSTINVNEVIEEEDNDKLDTTSVSKDRDSSVYVINRPNDITSRETSVRIISGQPQLYTKVVRSQNNRVVEVDDPRFSVNGVHVNLFNNVKNHEISEDDGPSLLNVHPQHKVYFEKIIREEPVNEHWEVRGIHAPSTNHQRQLQQLRTTSHNVVSRHFLVPYQRKHTVEQVIYQPDGERVYSSQTYHSSDKLGQDAQQQKHLQGQEQEDQQLNWEQQQQQ
ncbi:unnamed protein product [Psylliodes chrysocephalus]|uniref:Uncharacterized protein n=1 Tax=Psylliodes chrysocephalus TaxID=3402493 RepID=A0A9P0CTW9_9CUCU|nr:unnamed protein product [Psylliodes chrysocephala]